ncbi:MAG TPA: glycosyltransferase family 2 protein [Pyrinomonadaceae bacterium]|nr:glycosyltransferase family 2 protein [Pyrinomonadaceae bacterium]
MRVGTNPSKHAIAAKAPAPVTVALLVYVPFESGYFKDGLDVVRLCLQSVYQNTTPDHDVFVFDNGSAKSIVDFLQAEQRDGRIQYLALAGSNIGKPAALNFIFGAAPGEYIAYSDGDAFFFPGWLEAHLDILKTFPRVGIVNGLPARHLMDWATKSTIAEAQANPDIKIEKGRLIPEDVIASLCEGVGRSFDAYLKETEHLEDVKLTHRGVQAYVGAHHFQFVARKSVLSELGPMQATLALGRAELEFDEKIDRAGYMRLSTGSQFVFHLGNLLTNKWRQVAADYSVNVSGATRSSSSSLPMQRLRLRIRENSVVKRVLLKLYGSIFKLYYYGESKHQS